MHTLESFSIDTTVNIVKYYLPLSAQPPSQSKPLSKVDLSIYAKAHANSVFVRCNISKYMQCAKYAIILLTQTNVLAISSQLHAATQCIE
jgi:hypothetical protein